MAQLAAGDEAILQALFLYRVLTSSQLARATERSSAVVRRRMSRFLVPTGLATALDGGPTTEEKAYALGPEGVAMFSERLGLSPERLPFSARPPAGPGSVFFRHLRLTNDVLIAFAAATREPDSPMTLVEMIPEWTMVADVLKRRSKRHHERFVLSEAIADLENGAKVHLFRPDALIVLAPKDDPGMRAALYVEADRATEFIVRGPIEAKIEAYYHYCDGTPMRTRSGTTRSAGTRPRGCAA
jgi:hypothetical protein